MAELIQKAVNVLGGEACTGKHRIAVWMLVRDKQPGLNHDQIRADYDPEITESELDEED